MNGKQYQLARLNDSDVEQISLVAAPIKSKNEGQFLLLAGPGGAIVLPCQRTREMIDKDALKYQQVFRWPSHWAGELIIERPAIFERDGTGWKLKEHGILAGKIAVTEEIEGVVEQPAADQTQTLLTQKVEEETTKKSVAEYLNNIKAEDRVELTVDILNIEDNLLTATQNGELVLIWNGSDEDHENSLLVVPKATHFTSPHDYNKYDQFYSCTLPSAGEVQIIEPALVERTKGGLRLKRRGRLEITTGQVLELPDPPHEDTPATTSPDETDDIPFRAGDGAGLINEGEAQSRDKEIRAETFNKIQAETLPRFTESKFMPRLLAVIFGIIALGSVVAMLTWKFRTSTGQDVSSNSAQAPAIAATPTIRPSSTPPSSLAPPPDMVRVPAGEFMMGRDGATELEQPAHRVVIKKDFFIEINEVTGQQYESFLADNPEIPTPAGVGWKNRKCPAGKEKWPVSGVDWYGATSYAKSKGRRLPTEEEWEYAARGSQNFLYPWGNVWEKNAANAANTSRRQIVATGSYLTGVSPFGALDMVGNVWEWTDSDITSYSGGALPQRLSNGEIVTPGKVIRGGAWNSDQATATTTYRMGYPPRGAPDYTNTGFRCAMDAPSP